MLCSIGNNPWQCVSVQGPRLGGPSKAVVRLSDLQALYTQQNTPPWSTRLALLGWPTFTWDGGTFLGLLWHCRGWATILSVPKCATHNCFHQHHAGLFVSCQLPLSHSEKKRVHSPGSRVIVLPHCLSLDVPQFGKTGQESPYCIEWGE